MTSGTVSNALLELSAQNQTHAGSARGPRDPRVRARESRHTGRVREYASRVIGSEAELKMKSETLEAPFII